MATFPLMPTRWPKRSFAAPSSASSLKSCSPLVTSKIFDDYDIVAVQEISNKPQKVPYQFLDELNAGGGDDWAMLLSERTGREANDQTFQEQYAFYYKPEHVRPAGLVTEFPDSDDDLFQREPFAARFEAVDVEFTFVLINIHTRPANALDEIAPKTRARARPRVAHVRVYRPTWRRLSRYGRGWPRR